MSDRKRAVFGAAGVFTLLTAFSLLVRAQSVPAGSPQADAGDDLAATVGQSVLLDGARSTSPSGEPLTYQWTVVSGPGANTLSDAAAPRPRFTPMSAGDFVLRLTVTTPLSGSSVDVVTISTNGAAPVAHAGLDQRAAVGTQVRLAGSKSYDRDGDGLSYAWTLIARPSASAAVLNAPTSPAPDFLVDAAGDYLFDLVVTDTTGKASAPDRVVVSTVNVAPEPAAGPPQRLQIGQAATLDADGSIDADGDPLVAFWSLLSAPTTSTAALIDDASGRVRFTPDVAGDYVVQLQTSDDDVGAQKTFFYSTANAAPEADAGADLVATVGAAALLDGSRSIDIDGDALAYRWSIVSKPPGSLAALAESGQARTTIAPDLPGTYIAQLIVDDGQGLPSVDTVVVTTQGNLLSPVASASGDTRLSTAGVASLSAAGSSSPSGAPLSFQWSILGTGPLNDAIGNLSAASSAATDVSFFTGTAPLNDANSIAAVNLLRTNNVIVAGDLDAQSSIAGRVRVGGDLVGGSVNIGAGLVGADGTDVLLVAGDISGGVKNVNNGGNVRVRGTVSTTVNVTSPGQVIQDPTLTIAPQMATLTSFSGAVASLAPNSSIQIIQQGSQQVAQFTATPGPSGVAIFSIADGAAFFSTYSQVELNADLAGSSAIVINVGGAAIDTQNLRFRGDASTPAVSRRIIWNFHQATSLAVQSAFKGSILAPFAAFTSSASIDGAVVAASFTQQGHVGLPGFEGEGLVGTGLPQGLSLLQVKVSDGANAPAFDSVMVATDELRPVARVTGPSTGVMGAAIALSGATSSDPDGDALTYEWSLLAKPASSTATLAGAATANAGFTADRRGFYIAQLVVFDGVYKSRPVAYLIDIQNQKPVANAGADRTAFVGVAASFDGSASTDADGDSLTYAWTILSKPAGSAASLVNPASSAPSLTPDARGAYVVEFIVNDGIEDSAPDTATLTAPNRTPLANAGPDQTVAAGDLVMLSGALSADPDGDLLTYQWTLAQKPAGSAASLSNPTAASPTFTADVAGDYVAELVVADGITSSAADSVAVTAAPANRAPVLAAVGKKSVILGSSISIQLSATDPDGDSVSFFVAPLPLLSVSSFDSTSGQFTFRPSSADQIGSYTLTFGASDGSLSDAESVVVNIAPDPAGGVTSFGGRVVDATDGTTPVAGATVMVGTVSAVTDANGQFSLSGIAAGDQLVMITPNVATSPDGTPYASSQFSLAFVNGVANTNYDDFLLPRRNGTSVQTVAGIDTIIDDPALGLRAEIPADSVKLAPPEARFWRILISTIGNSAEFASLGDLEFRVAANGPTALVGGVISASSVFSGSTPPSNLLDGNSSTVWAGAVVGGAGDWIAYDFGAGREVSIREVSLTARTGSLAAGQTPTGFKVQHSDDGTNWTTVSTIAGDPVWAASENRSYPVQSDYVGAVSLAAISPEQANQLPPYVSPCQLFSLEPKGVLFTEPVTLKSANLDGLPANTVVDVWRFEPEGFVVAGAGTVSANGATIEVVLDGVTGGSLLAFAPRPPIVARSGDTPDSHFIPSVLGDGNFAASYKTPSHFSIGRERALTFVYNSASADPRPIVNGAATISSVESVPATLQSTLRIGGAGVSPVTVTTTQSGLGGAGPISNGTVAVAASFDASALETGVYPYELITLGKRACSASGGVSTGRIAVNNLIGSPIGRGWSIAEVGRIYPQTDGSVMLTEGDGRSLIFDVEEVRIDQQDFTNLDNIVLDQDTVANNSTPVVAPDGKVVLRLTRSASFQRGSAFFKDRLPIASPDGTPASFSNFFSFQMSQPGGISDSDGQGADGIAFVLADKSSNLGAAGGGLGYQNVTPSFVVEFDSWLNSWDSNGNHIGVNLNGNVTSLKQVAVSPRFNNSAVWYAWIDYDGPSRTLEVRAALSPERPAEPLLTHVIDIPLAMGRSDAFFGFTSGTGSAFNNHDIREWGLSIRDVVTQTIVYRSPLSDFSKLVRNADNTFDRVLKDGTTIHYDENGLQTFVQDTNGNRTAYQYDAEGRVIGVTDPAGGLVTIVYADGTIETVTDPAGRITAFEHDAAGDLVRVIDDAGGARQYGYDDNGRLISEVTERGFATSNNYGFAGRYVGSDFPDGSSVSLQIAKTFGLDGLGTEIDPNVYVPEDQRVSEIVDGNGNATTVEVNAFGAPVRVTDAIGRISNFMRNEDNLVTEARVPAEAAAATFVLLAAPIAIFNRVDEFDYDASGNVIAQREAVGTALQRETLFEYEPQFNKVTKIVDPDGFATLFAYDPKGNLLSVTDAAGGVRAFTYNADGLVLTETDENSRVTAFEYDPRGLLSRVIDASGDITQLFVDEAGNTQLRVEAVGTSVERRTSFVYDFENRVLSSTDGELGATTFAYDAVGNLTAVTDPTGVLETRTYDELNRLASIDDPAIGLSSFTYDGNGNLLTQTDAAGQVTTFEYDAVDRRTKSIDPLLQQRLFTYDLRDNITAVTDARGSVTEFAFDILDRPTTRLNPAGEAWTFAYDRRDNRTLSTKPGGSTVTAQYDALSRLTSLAGSANVTPPLIGAGAVSRSYGYDPASNLVMATAALDSVAGAALAFTYDAENRVARAETRNIFGGGTLNAAFDYGYDRLDRRSVMTDSFGGVVSYAYDRADRLTAVTTPSGALFETSYDLAGRMTGRTGPNVTDLARAFEAGTGRLSSQTARAGALAFNGLAYGYEARGNIAQVAETGLVARTRNYGYDELERLTNVTAPSAPANDESYAYDAEGNRAVSHLSAAHQTDAANRLRDDDFYSYVYDSSGNLIAKAPKLLALSSWDYVYDALDELIEVRRDGVVVEQYRHDALGRRARIITAGANDTGLVSDGPDRTLDLAANGAGGRLAARYVHGAEIDEPLQMEAFNASGALTGRYAYHADHLGSVRFLTDDLGEVVNSYDYDSYGRRVAVAEAVPQPFAFTGREWSVAAGLYDYRARAYDPDTGRFLQEDPIWFNAGDFNSYRYVWNDPVGFNDPSGLAAATEDASTLLIAAGLVGGGAAILTAQDLATAESTAETFNRSVTSLSGVARGIACTFFSVASGLNGGSTENCGAPALANDNAAPPPPAVQTPATPEVGSPPPPGCGPDGEPGQVHGNSLDSPKKTTLYGLRSNSSGEIVKYGITGNPDKRYTQKFLEENDAFLDPLRCGSRRDMRNLEKRANRRFFDRLPFVKRP